MQKHEEAGVFIPEGLMLSFVIVNRENGFNRFLLEVWAKTSSNV